MAVTVRGGDILFNDGTTQSSAVNPSGAAKAWVNFNGTDTVGIRAAFNVSSITDNGTGDYTVNFTTAMPDANYSMVGFANSFSDGTGDQAGLVTAYRTLSPPTTTAFRFTVANSYNGDVFDASRIAVVFFG